jgi:hypothetical protein
MDASSSVNARARSQGWHSIQLETTRSILPPLDGAGSNHGRARISLQETLAGDIACPSPRERGLDDRPAADIQARGFRIDFSQHLRVEIDLHPRDGIHHLSAGEKSGDILTLIRHGCDGFGTAGLIFLCVLFIPGYFFFRGFPECHQMVVLPVIILPDFKNQRVEAPFHPAPLTKPKPTRIGAANIVT